LTLTIPSDALPSGTLVKIYLNKNLSTAGEIISSTNHFLNFVVGWTNTNDGSLPVATSPLVIHAVNASIKKGMVGYGILNGVPAPLGTATSDGSITLYMTEDPLLVVAPTKPGSPTDISASSDPGQSSIVSWVIPENDGGEPITGYIATASPGGNSCIADGATATSCTITDLNADTSYTFTVRAINQVGPSDPSDASNNPDVDPTPSPSADAESDAEGGAEGDPEGGAQGSFANTTEATASTPSPSPSKSAPNNLVVPTQTTPAPQAIAPETDSLNFGLIIFWIIAIAVLLLVALLVTLWRRRFSGVG
jgi:hypothetical protein